MLPRIGNTSFQLNTSAAYAVLLTLTLIGLALYGLMELADRWIVFWNRDQRLQHRVARATAKHSSLLAPSTKTFNEPIGKETPRP